MITDVSIEVCLLANEILYKIMTVSIKIFQVYIALIR